MNQVHLVLDIVRRELEAAGWRLALGRRASGGIPVSGVKGAVLVDGIHADGAVLWVETGRSWINFAFLQHAVEAAMLPTVQDVVVAVREQYSGPAFEKARGFLDDVFNSRRLVFPYRSLTLLGY